MAQHGGRTIPRAHRPRAPIIIVDTSSTISHSTTTATPSPTLSTTSIRPFTAPSQQQQSVVVTLQAPRPDVERISNEYVETPFRSVTTTTTTTTTTRVDDDKSPHLLLPLINHHHHTTNTASGVTVKQQPIAFTKEHPNNNNNNSRSGAGFSIGSCLTPVVVVVGSAASSSSSSSTGASSAATPTNIICSECGRCRCDSCRTSRALPSRWICDNTCLCSADAVIDYVSCLCCVKGLYYHYSDTDAGVTSCADAPCSCAPPRRVARWACMGALAALLPCLLCYWPLRGCQRAIEAGYARHSRAGCRCRPQQQHQITPEKRLLDATMPY